jgi:hypothetical protein
MAFFMAILRWLVNWKGMDIERDPHMESEINDFKCSADLGFLLHLFIHFTVCQHVACVARSNMWSFEET